MFGVAGDAMHVSHAFYQGGSIQECSEEISLI
jgi:hypothetical protein